MKLETILLDLPLRGERKYLSSTTILTELQQRFELKEAVSLEVRQIMYHPIILSEEEDNDYPRVGSFSFMENGTKRTFGIFSDQGRMIEGRVHCNEKDIVALYDKGTDQANGVIGNPGNFIETIVPLNKAIVARHADKGKKVYFCAIKLDFIPDSGNVGVILKKKLGTRLFQSTVQHESKRIGILTFMVI